MAQRLPRAVLALTWVLFGCFALALVVPLRDGPPEFEPWRDVGFYAVVTFAAAAAVLLKALRRPRLLNRFLACGAIVLFGIASLRDSLVTAGGEDVEFFDLSDALYLAFYVLLAIIFCRVMQGTRTVRAEGLWLDTSIVLLGCTSVSLAVGSTVVPTGEPIEDAVVTMSFIAFDVALLLLAVGTHLVDRLKVDAVSGWSMAALAALAVGDLSYAYGLRSTVYAEGGLMDLTWLFAMVALATAAFGRSKLDLRTEQGVNRLGLPGVAAGLAAAVLLWDQLGPGLGAAVWAALAAVMLTVIRAFRSNATLRALWRAQHDARSDQLTGLANHRALSEVLTGSVELGEPFTCLLVQVDGIREVNDALGHGAGDGVVAGVARMLADVGGDAPFRIGEHRFCFVVETGGDVEALAARIHEVLAHPLVIDGTEIPLSACIGAATWPDDASDSVELLAVADAAVRDARRTGRSLVLHSRPEVTGTLRFEVLHEIRSRIERGVVELEYQPQIRVEDAAVVGVEALARCTSSTLGPVGPDVFIPVVESAGLMPAFTRLVVRQAIDDALAWRTKGVDVEVSVNVALTCLYDDDFLVMLHRELTTRALGLAAPLTVELTEEAMGRDVDEVLPVLEALRADGCRIAMDDFGKGHSSMARLHQLPVDVLKLDRELLEVDPFETRSLEFFTALASLGAALGMTTLAEGVESTPQLDLLRRAGIDTAQGYLVAGSMAAGRFPEWVVDYRRAIAELDGHPTS